MENRIFETTCLVWIDENVHTSQDVADALAKLRMTIGDVKKFTSIDEFQPFLQQMRDDDRVFIITTGRMGSQLVSKIYQHRSIVSVFVFCMDRARNEAWSKPFKKVRAVVTNIPTLIQKFEHDVQKHYEYRYLNTISFNLLNDMNARFLLYHTLIDQIHTIKSDKNDFFQWAENFYKNDTNQIEILRETNRTYDSSKAIDHFVRETCFSRLLPKTFRIENIDQFILLHWFIQDLISQMKSESHNSSIEVYRCEWVTTEDVLKLHQANHHFISINEFFTASFDRKDEMKILEKNSAPDGFQKVLFEIRGQPCTNVTRPFITLNSTKPKSKENRVLFCCGSIFQINSVKHDKNGIVLVEMEFVDKRNEKFVECLRAAREEFQINGENSRVIDPCYIYSHLKMYDKASLYLEFVLKTLPDPHEESRLCQHARALLAFQTFKFEAALNFFEPIASDNNHSDSVRASSLFAIGCINQKGHLHSEALKSYKQASEIWINVSGERSLPLADCFNNIGCVQETLHMHSEALKSHMYALDIRKILLSENDLAVAASMNNIGNVYLAMGQFDDAMSYYQSAMDMRNQATNIDESKLALLFENQGLTFERQGVYDSALAKYKQAQDTFESSEYDSFEHRINIREDIERMTNLTKRVSKITEF